MSELPKTPAPSLTEEEKSTYEWQIWTEDFGEEGQRRLKNSTVLISRCGGLGSVVAYELAAAGVGRLIIAHGGNVKHSDLNRQLLMTHDWLGKPRIETIERRLKDLNPRIEIVPIAANLDDELAEKWVPQSDVCVGAAPLFKERFAMNDACVRHGKPHVNCAMFDTEATITTFPASGVPCLRCLTPELPKYWKREFPVFGATSGTVACIGAMEAIKLLAGFGQPLHSQILHFNLRTMVFEKLAISPDENCKVCGSK
ncbi:HesA/MoeB/ThiF family protein [Mariniblastus fucicola]|uniref:Molybdopterin-synthase adenylyltransferase n=1 Tax=Mariniblastus fucicola TaxID=980251 RepID=A0A5B9PI08_9BACT|nr:HesA/MoeB/ThiF family protein [Mariniblastus fucicola]QEG24930.1 Molybdopterin-synthase adenylyltransferase [Mariniblastus fucicola]